MLFRSKPVFSKKTGFLAYSRKGENAMLVKDRMTKNLITIAEDTPISDALQIIR